MNVAGIDFSSHAIDIVLIDIDNTQPPRWDRFPLTGGARAFDRARTVPDHMPTRGSSYWDNVTAVGIEQPAGKFKPGSGYRIQGAALACIPARLPVREWSPGEWRKACGLPGNATKQVVTLYVWAESQLHDWSSSDWPQDACDAYCVAHATLQLDAIAVTNPDPQQA